MNNEVDLKFNIGDRVALKNKDQMLGTIIDKITDLCMVELDDGSIDAYYNRQLNVI